MKELGRRSFAFFYAICLLLVSAPLGTFLHSRLQLQYDHNNFRDQEEASMVLGGGRNQNDAKIMIHRFLLEGQQQQKHDEEDSVQQETTTTTIMETAQQQQQRQQLLPSATQGRAKGVNSRCDLNQVFAKGSEITSIEADITMGQVGTCPDPTASTMVPIMAHPPDMISDLSMEDFLDFVSTPLNDGTSRRSLTHHIKLDFKDIDVVSPTLQVILDKNIVESTYQFQLNADVVAGPGYNDNEIETDPSVFIPLGLDTITQQISASGGSTNIAWSLGFRTRYENCGNGYETSQIQAMNDIITTYNLLPNPITTDQGVGVILAMNARQLAKSLDVVSSNFLSGGIWADTTADQLQILAWMGRSEPAICRSIVTQIQDHFQQNNLSDRIGFDLPRIAEGSRVINFFTNMYGRISSGRTSQENGNDGN